MKVLFSIGVFIFVTAATPLAHSAEVGFGTRCLILLRASVTRGPHQAIKIWKALSPLGKFTSVEDVSSTPPNVREILESFLSKQTSGKIDDRYAADLPQLLHPSVTKESFPEGINAYLENFLKVDDNIRENDLGPIAVYLGKMSQLSLFRPDLGIAVDQLFLKALNNPTYNYNSLLWNAVALWDYVGNYYFKFHKAPKNFDGPEVLMAFEKAIRQHSYGAHYGPRIRREILKPVALLLGIEYPQTLLASP